MPTLLAQKGTCEVTSVTNQHVRETFLTWVDHFSRAFRGRSAFEIGDSLLKAFDRVGSPPERWGTPLELEAQRRNIALFSDNIDCNPYLSSIGRYLLRCIMRAHLHNRARTIAFYERNRTFTEPRGRYVARFVDL